jgi:7-cyano-7-deazaguanine synthase in queuosine biosynthesis
LSPAEAQGRLFSIRPGHGAAVACFSGGLDSFGGAAIDIWEQQDLEFVLVGASGTGRARSLQRDLAETLRERTGRVQPVLIKANLVGAKRRDQDRHQRSRGFLFLSLAAATAMVSGVDDVRIYENGVGAINLPYSRGQVGAHMSRSAHPKTLAGMQQLTALIGIGNLRFTLPRVFDTKAMLVARLPEPFADLIPTTVSCDTWSSDRQPSPPEQERAHRCGKCSSCILRRQSLRAAGLDQVDAHEKYRCDVLSAEALNKETFALRLMLEQVSELRCAVDGDHPWQALVEAFPQLVDARDSLVEIGAGPGIEGRLVSLYRAYVEEWHAVPGSLVDRYLGNMVTS